MGVTTTTIPSTSSVDDETIEIDADGNLSLKDSYEAELNKELGSQQIEIIELQANATITPFDHNTLIAETFSDSDGYNDLVNTGNTELVYDSTNKYYESLFIDFVDDFNRTVGTTIGNSWTEDNSPNGGSADCEITSDSNSIYGNELHCDTNAPGSGLGQARCKKNIGNQATFDYTFLVKAVSSNNGTSGVWINETSSGSNDGCAFQITGTQPTFDINFYDATITLKHTASFTNNTWYYVRIAYDGTNLKGKVWLKTASEPGTWDFDSASTNGSGDYIECFSSAANGSTKDLYVDAIIDHNGADQTGAQLLEIDLPTITGTVLHTELITNSTLINDDSITYDLTDGTYTDSDLAVNTKNAISTLTDVPTKLQIYVNRSTIDQDQSWVKSICLKLWKA